MDWRYEVSLWTYSRGVSSSLSARILVSLLLVGASLTSVAGLPGEAVFADLQGQRAALLAAATRQVCKSGCTYSTITAAVNASNSGDTIKVAQGTYDEVVHVYNKSLTIRGGYSGLNWDVQDPATYVTIVKANTAAPTVKLVGPDGGTYTGTLDGFTITGGNPSSLGGGVFVSKYRATISDNRIHNNSASSGGGISVSDATNVVIRDNVIEDNTVSGGGGGIRVQDSTVSIIGNEILDNAAANNGGGIHVIGGTVTIDDNTIKRNISRQKGGGGIMVDGGSDFTISNNLIARNRANLGGGGIRVEASEGLVQGNDIKRNSTSRIGGGLTVYEAQVDVDDNDFSLNTGAKGGGGLQFTVDSLGLISNNRIVDNEGGADSRGGGIHFWRSSPRFVGNTVTGNTAATAGGGVHIEECSPLIQDNMITENHSGEHGGGVNVAVSSAPTLIGNTIGHNTASARGGGVFGYDGAIQIDGNEVVDNQAPTAGGIYLVSCVGFEITNNIIARNKATVEGGGIHLTSGNRGNIINNTLVNNNLAAGGEAINLSGNGSLRIANNILVGHTYGVRLRDGTAPTVEYNDVWNSSVKNYEGVSGNPGHISCDPQFVDIAGGDNHLTAGSCAIDNGTQSGAPAADFDGDERPLDGDGDGNVAWDRGADEYFNAVWVTKEVDQAVVDPGDLIAYTITYRNNSASTVTGVVISDILSDDLINSDYSFSGPTLTLQDDAKYVWDVSGGLAPGAEGSIVITAQVDPSLATPTAILNEVQLSMNGYGPFQDDALVVVGGLRTYAPAVLHEYQ
jgi:uncharacterized repeat protein (TIGR01451 family)